MANNFRGPEEDNEISASSTYRNTKTLGQRVNDFISNPVHAAGSIALLAGMNFSFELPLMPEITTLIGGGLTWFSLTRKGKLPFRMPQSCGEKIDWGDLHASGAFYNSPRGISYFGNRLSDQREVWFSDDDMRTHILIFGSTGSGKAQPLDAKVLTPNGWIKMGDVRNGTIVCTPDGKSATVNGIFPQGKMDIFEIEFEDGRKTRATADHLWEVHNKGWYGRKFKKGEKRSSHNVRKILTTSEIEMKLSKFKSQKYSVTLPVSNFSNGKSLPVHPYILGAMIGGGNFTGRNFRISMADAEVKARFESFLPEELYLKNYECDSKIDFWILQKEPKLGRAVNGDYQIMPMTLSFKTMGLWDKQSHEKFIPEDYLNASFEDRMWILKGLMDTDGTSGNKGSASFSTASRRLAEDFQKLVWSVGGIAKITEKATTFTYKGEKKSGRVSYRINIRHNDPHSLFSISRKSDRLKDYQYADNVRLGFKSIRKIGFEEAQCIHVDHPDHLYITDNFITTHNTEALLSLSYNALNQGSGFIYVDGKGDNSLWSKIYGMVRERGREDDLLVINYMTGNSDIGEGPKEKLLSNTMNPFSNGSSDGLTQLMVGLMDGGDGKGDMWKGRAIGFMSGLMVALVGLRDAGHILLDVSLIRDYLVLDKLIDLAKDDRLSDRGKVALDAYLKSIPGFEPAKGKKQSDTVRDQHGYLQMQFTKILGSLGDTYGHIFNTQLGDVDFYDVVVNRRILVVLLPALEKSPDELANLGKIIVASLKSMMATGLGSAIEGSYKDVVLAKPNNSPAPFTTILDEYGYYAVPGSAVMPAQARSLGFSMVFAGQDLPAFEKASPEEAASILGNCNIKIFMKLEEPEKTFKLAESSAGEAYVTVTGGFNNSSGGMVGLNYMDNQNASVEKRSRIEMRDLKSQKPGEAHVIFGGTLVRMKWFYAKPPTPKSMVMRVNQFLRIKPPKIEKIQQMDEAISSVMRSVEAFSRGEKVIPEPVEVTDITTIAKAWHGFSESLQSSPIERSIASLLVYSKEIDERLSSFEEDAVSLDTMMNMADAADGNMGSMFDDHAGMIFSGPDPSTLSDVFGGNPEAKKTISESILSRHDVEDGIRNIEKAAGATKEDSDKMAKRVTMEVSEASNYPTTPMSPCNPEEFVNAMSQLDSYIVNLEDDKDESNS